MKRLGMGVLFVVLCGRVSYALDEYPEWFLCPKLYDDVIIGLSYRNTPPVIDAATTYCVFKRCIVDGYLEVLETEDGHWLKNTQYYYFFSHSDLKAIQDSLYYVGGFCTSALTEDVITAFSTNKGLELSDSTIRVIDTPIPDWVDRRTWSDSTFFYGVGMFTSTGNENDAWKTSEEQAVYNILTSIAVKVFSRKYSLEVTWGGIPLADDYKDYLRFELKFNVEGIETLERWPDVTRDYFYTLVRIRKDGVISYLRK